MTFVRDNGTLTPRSCRPTGSQDQISDRSNLGGGGDARFKERVFVALQAARFDFDIVWAFDLTEQPAQTAKPRDKSNGRRFIRQR